MFLSSQSFIIESLQQERECDDCEAQKRGGLYRLFVTQCRNVSEFDALNRVNFTGVDNPTTDGISLLVDEIVQCREVYISVQVFGTVVVLNDCEVTTCINLQIFDHGRINVGNFEEHNKTNVSVNRRHETYREGE